MRKGWIALLCAALVICAVPTANAEEDLTLSARCAVLTGPDGQILYERAAHERCPIASTTKLMTALVALDHCDLREEVAIDAAACGIEGSSLYLQPGERYTAEELLTGLLLVSGNDAAEALALHCAGSEARFVAWMNEKAVALGMQDSHFMNPHGLSDPEHYGSAADLTVLLRACLERTELAGILGKSSATVGEQCIANHNKLLWRCPGCLGGKTGYTLAAGRYLVSCCERDGTRLYCATLSAPDDWNDQLALYEWGFARFATRNVTENLRFSVPVISGSQREVSLRADPLWLFLPLDAELQIETELPRFVFPPAREGETGGLVTVLRDGEILGSAALRFAESVQAQKKETIP